MVRAKTLTCKIGSKFKCGFCPTSFKTKAERDVHLSQCAYRRFYCEYCYHSTTKLANLQTHIKSHHSDIAEIQKSKTSEVGSTSNSGKNVSGTQYPESVFKNGDISEGESMRMEDDVRKVEWKKDNDSIVIGRSIRKRTMPKLASVKNMTPENKEIGSSVVCTENGKISNCRCWSKVAEEKGVVQNKSNEIQEDKEQNVDVHAKSALNGPSLGLSTGGSTSASIFFSVGVQTDPLIYTKFVETVTTYIEGSRKVRVTERKEAI